MRPARGLTRSSRRAPRALPWSCPSRPVSEASAEERDGLPAGVVAVPMIAGLTNFGVFGNAVCLTCMVVKPAARMESSVGRLQSQLTTSRLSQFIRSWRRARPGSADRTCSMNRSWPPGRSTRRSSRSARG